MKMSSGSIGLYQPNPTHTKRDSHTAAATATATAAAPDESIVVGALAPMCSRRGAQSPHVLG